MINTIKTSFFLLFVIVLSSCNDSRKLETIRQAEMLMQEQPDSALRMLQTINRHSLRGKTLARYALIYSIAQDKSGLDVTNDSLLRIAHEYYSQHPDDSLYARSQYYMGKYLHLTAQKDSAYACLLRSKNTSEEDNDYYTAYLATDRMRRIAEVSDTSLCLYLSKDAYRLYQKQGANNPVNEAYLLIGIGDSYFRRGDGDSAIHYYNIALEKSESVADSILIASVLQSISRQYWHYKQYNIALHYAQQALSYQGYLNESLATLLASCFIENNEYNKAQQYINALPQTASKGTQLVRIRMQHRLSARTGDADAAQEYFDSACDVAADMYLSIQKDKLELHRKNLHEALERQRAEFRGKFYATCLGFTILLLILIAWLFLKYRRSKKAEINHQKIQNKTLEELRIQEKKRFQAEEELFRTEEARLLQEKNYKEHLMEQMRNYIKKIVNFQQKIEKEKGAQKKHIVLDDNDWNEIQAYLDACDGSFVTRFKEHFPDISEKDYRLCLLLRCGFTNSDLEMVYSITHQAIKTKQRLLKISLGIEDETVSLRKYIMGF